MTSPGPASRRRLVILGAVVLGVVGYGTVGFMVVEGWTLREALYMTFLTLTTVGYKEVRPLTPAGQIFAMTLLVLGVSTVIAAFSMGARTVAEGGFGERARRRRMQRKIERMRDHFIVCAYGRVGRSVARELRDEGVPFLVIEPLEELGERLSAEEVVHLIGDPAAEDVLRAAGIERARGLICAMDSDAKNVFITLMARSLNPETFIVARASESSAIERLTQAGANRVVSPYITSGRQMALAVLRPRVLDSMEVTPQQPRNVILEEIDVEDGSNIAGRALGEVCGDAVAVAMRRGDDVVPNPGRDTVLQPGDVLVLLGERHQLRPVEG